MTPRIRLSACLLGAALVSLAFRPQERPNPSPRFLDALPEAAGTVTLALEPAGNVRLSGRSVEAATALERALGELAPGARLEIERELLALSLTEP